MNLRAFTHPGARILAMLGLMGLLGNPTYSETVTPPISGVEVLVENVISGKTAATRTEDTGRFMLTGLEPGEYRLIIGIADVRLSVYGGAMTAQWVPASSPKVRVGIVFAVPSRASGTIAGTIKPAAPPAVQTRITWPVLPSFGN